MIIRVQDMSEKLGDEALRPLTCRNPKRHIPLVSFLLWHKMVAVHPFIWALGLRLWSVSEVVRQRDEILTFGDLKKIYIRPPVSDFVFLKMYFMLYGLILFHTGDFCSEVCL